MLTYRHQIAKKSLENVANLEYIPKTYINYIHEVKSSLNSNRVSFCLLRKNLNI
jgi:hypothetical protein